MAALLSQLLDVILLRRGPQDLPYSPPASRAAIAALLLAQGAITLVADTRPDLLVARLAVTVLLLFGLVPLLLRWRQVGNRAAQTLLALAGTSAMFTLAMLPWAILFRPHMGNAEPPSYLLLPALVVIVLFVWKLRVDAAIWRAALDLRGTPALLLAVALVVLQSALVQLLAPADPSTPP